MIELKKLGDVCSFNRGKTITANNAVAGNIPVIAGGQKPSYFHNESNRIGESIVVAGSGAYAGFVSYWNKPIFVSDAFTIDPNQTLNKKYLFHWLKKNQSLIYATQRGAGVPHVHGKDIANFEIPVPTLPEQNRIVSILDIFISSINNLDEQIEQRQKQFEYYRGKLLSFEERAVEYIKLGKLCQIRNGYTPSKTNLEYWTNGNIPWFRLEDIRQNGRILSDAIQHITEIAVKKGGPFKENSVIVSTTATIGEHAIITVPFVCNQQITILTPFEDSVLPKYLYYCGYLIGEWCKNNVNGAGLAIIPSNKLTECEIPVPSLDRQLSIVRTLDLFESLLTNLKKERELRQKQYEYYREKLLTFA